MSQPTAANKQQWLNQIENLKSFFWDNPFKLPFEEAMKVTHMSAEDIRDAEARLERFASYIQIAFPETAADHGLIESHITAIPHMHDYLEKAYNTSIPGKYYLKRDDQLPIAGTIKARGAIYEVLKHAETLALEAGLLKSIDEDYAIFASDTFHEFFAQRKIMVGTTGNLGISVGVMGAKLGFQVTVHMSADAKSWKKELLRSRGVTVVEHRTNFSLAVEEGRKEAEADDATYFVDDEFSIDLFYGYSTAARRLQKQLADEGITVDRDHPLFVYSPCGIGGSPGGTAYGLKNIFGDHVYCFFAQPTHMPSMLVGLITQEFNDVSVMDFGIDAITNMDGLAVPRTSGVVSEIMQYFFDGGYTLQEEEASHLLTKMIELENIPLEPAALAGVPGPAKLFQSAEGQAFLAKHHLEDKVNQITHLAWATGGSMVPKEDMDIFYQEGLSTEIESD